MSHRNPCITCGACCISYRVSFYWGETDTAIEGGVPSHLTEQLTPFYAVMKGTNNPSPRCIALEGTIGCSVGCSIHALRPSPCRAFEASYFDGKTVNPRCDESRLRHGLPILSPKDWEAPEGTPQHTGPQAYDPVHHGQDETPPMGSGDTGG